MSAREMLLKDVPIMPERFIEKIYIMWQNEKNEASGSELAEIIGEDEILASVEEIKNGKFYGPFDSAEEAFRSLMED
jgi:hypothetical protein